MHINTSPYFSLPHTHTVSPQENTTFFPHLWQILLFFQLHGQISDFNNVPVIDKYHTTPEENISCSDISQYKTESPELNNISL